MSAARATDELLRTFFRAVADRGGVASPIEAVGVTTKSPALHYKVEIIFLAGRAITRQPQASFQLKFEIPVHLLSPGYEDELAGTLRAALSQIDSIIREQEGKAARSAEPPVGWKDRPPDLMEHVIGFRIWKTDGERLLPWGQGAPVWDGPREVKAHCTKNAGHHAPVELCHCGFNVYHSIHNVWPTTPDTRHLVGAVLARGKLQVHGDGFRAEYARPLALGYDFDHQAEFHCEAVAIPIPGEDHALGREYVRGQEWWLPSDRERVERIAQQVGLPAMPYEKLTAYAQEHGALMPDELKPKGDEE